MIQITVTGDTFQLRKRLTENHYRWNAVTKSWQKTIGEASLDYQCEQLRPMRSLSDTPEPRIILELQQVDINGNPLSPNVTKVHLRSMARSGETISEIFNRENNSVITVPPIQLSPSPINPKKQEIKKNKMEGFF
jgi:hypothetical protein